jgi:hypothetical protein
MNRNAIYSSNGTKIKRLFSLLVIAILVSYSSAYIYTQELHESLKPVSFITEGENIFLKAEMSPASPDDLKHRSIRWRSDDSAYAGRQFLAKGATGRELIIAAFRTSGDRVLDKANLTDTFYSIEVIVPKGFEAMLFSFLKQAIQAGLGVTAAWENIETKVGILRRNPSLPLNIKPSMGKKGSLLGDYNKVSGVAQPISKLTKLLGVHALGFPVIDETRLRDKYDFNVEWQENNQQSLKKNLEELGLILTIEKRPIEMVVIRPHRSIGP